MFSFYYLYLFVIIFNVCGALRQVSDDDLMNLIRSETYLITLFTSKNCEQCDNFENTLNELEDNFTKELNGQTVKVMNSQLLRLYSPTKEPVLIFFRHGIPLLYNDVPSENLIFDSLMNNREPIVKELNDDIFEHLTQVATGATTGDWFVMFYTSDCVDCQRLHARWETVGAHLKSRMNVARVNKGTTGAATAARFGVTQVPTFILFRLGKMYRYHLQKYDIGSFVSFAQDWYKNMKPEKVPHPKTPFDDLVENTVLKLKENFYLVQIIALLSVLSLIVFILIKCRKGQLKPQSTKKEDKEK